MIASSCLVNGLRAEFTSTVILWPPSGFMTSLKSRCSQSWLGLRDKTLFEAASTNMLSRSSSPFSRTPCVGVTAPGAEAYHCYIWGLKHRWVKTEFSFDICPSVARNSVCFLRPWVDQVYARHYSSIVPENQNILHMAYHQCTSFWHGDTYHTLFVASWSVLVVSHGGHCSPDHDRFDLKATWGS